MASGIELNSAARDIFAHALRSVDSGDAVRRAVHLEDSRLKILDTTLELGARRAGIYALALGKAALPMAAALDEVLGEKLTAGLIVSPKAQRTLFKTAFTSNRRHSSWSVCEGGHPLPDEASLKAASHAFELLRRADEESALVIFLISGGGSAMMEWPRDGQITLREIREANRLLVSCGASIAEINAVRRAFSAIKGGRLAACAPLAGQVSLIISDTPKGQESIVASGPTCSPPTDAPDAASVIKRYQLTERLPTNIMRAVNQPPEVIKADDEVSQHCLREHYVLLDNDCALEAAAEAARRMGFAVEIARDITEQSIDEGCALMLSRLDALLERAAAVNKTACLISGGEFACPVRGDGSGGRNSETVLRCVLELDERLKQEAFKLSPERVAILSAGTDGIDGNSPAAGARADETTIERASKIGLDPHDFLERSDAYGFFNQLSDTLLTGHTGTNVRDVRIMLAD